MATNRAKGGGLAGSAGPLQFTRLAHTPLPIVLMFRKPALAFFALAAVAFAAPYSGGLVISVKGASW